MARDWMDHSGTPHVVCPHCGVVFEDDIYFLESRPGGGKEKCEGCGKWFRFDVDYTIRFTTRPLPEPTDPST